MHEEGNNMSSLDKLVQRILAGPTRITDDEYRELEANADLFQLGIVADTIRQRLHPENIVSYVIDRNINYTDVCISACKFCAFFKAPDQGGYVLSYEELQAKIDETKRLGGTQILLQGGLHPDLATGWQDGADRLGHRRAATGHGLADPAAVLAEAARGQPHQQ